MIDRTTLLTQLSKLYVVGELGLDLKTFVATPDSAWVSFAARLLRRPQQARGPRRAGYRV